MKLAIILFLCGWVAANDYIGIDANARGISSLFSGVGDKASHLVRQLEEQLLEQLKKDDKQLKEQMSKSSGNQKVILENAVKIFEQKINELSNVLKPNGIVANSRVTRSLFSGFGDKASHLVRQLEEQLLEQLKKDDKQLKEQMSKSSGNQKEILENAVKIFEQKINELSNVLKPNGIAANSRVTRSLFSGFGDKASHLVRQLEEQLLEQLKKDDKQLKEQMSKSSGNQKVILENAVKIFEQKINELSNVLKPNGIAANSRVTRSLFSGFGDKASHLVRQLEEQLLEQLKKDDKQLKEQMSKSSGKQKEILENAIKIFEQKINELSNVLKPNGIDANASH